MAQNHLEEVLKATGLPEDQVKALVELPADAADFKTDGYVAPIRTNVETQVKNDPKFYEGLNKDNLPKEFVQKLEAEQYGRSAAIVRGNMLKAVGLTEKDFADLGEDGKKIDVFTPAFVKKLSEGKVTDKELQAKLIEANTKIQEMEAALPETEEKYKAEYATKIADFQIATGVINELASVPGLKAPAKYLADNVTNQLRAKYAFELVNGQVEIRQKDKPTLKVLTDNGTKELTLAGAIDQILTADDLVDKKKATTTTTTTTKVDTSETGLKISKNVDDKIKKRLAEDAKAGGQS
jgi:hypothetical protein